MASSHLVPGMDSSPQSGYLFLTKSVRKLRSLIMRRIPLFKTLGHGILFAAYTAINLGLSLNIEWTSDPVKEFAKRLGWFVS